MQQWGYAANSYLFGYYEGLPNFYDTFKFEDSRQVIKLEEELNKNYGVTMENPDIIERMKTKKNIMRREMSGSPWYSILHNEYYMQ